MEKKQKCPKCGSNNTVPIMYGMPPYELLEKEEIHEVILGGCIVHDDSPSWHCKDCEHYWGKYSDYLEKTKEK